MDYSGQHFGSSSNDLPEVTSSAEAASSLAPYPATSGSWAAVQDPHGSASSSYPSHGLPAYGSSGYYPTDTSWSASGNPFESSFHGATTMGYSNPTDMYNYTYHQGSAAFSASTSPTYPLDGSTAMGMDPSDGMSAVSGHHHSHHSHHHKKDKESTRKQKQPKSQKTSFFSPLSPSSASSSSTPANSKSKLRSASRTSKNTHHNPPATEEERRNRESHNQVEKQYRNRLNAHFESLLNALPENLRGGGGDEDEDEGMDAGGGGGGGSGDRRVSKAEVLDMARRHIQALERECSALEGERDELRENMEKLQWLFKKCSREEGGRREDFQGPMGA